MSSVAYPWIRSSRLSPVALGAWAAVIAIAPGLSLKLAFAAPAVLLPLTIWTLEAPGRWLLCFFAAALLLPPLPIALGNSGPHICLFFAALGLFAGIFWFGRWRIPASALNGALAGLFIVLLASLAPAAIYSGAAVAAGSLARLFLFAIALYVFLFTAHGPAAGAQAFPVIRAVYCMAAASALFACIDFYFQFPAPAGYGPQFVWLDSGVYRRAQGFFYEASTLGNFCAFFLVMIAVCFARPREDRPVSRAALLLGGVVFFFALVLSFSRSSLLNVVTALIVLAWLHRKRIHFARLGGILALCVALASLLGWKLFPQFLEAYWLRLSTSAEYLTSATEGVFSGRLASWSTLTAWMAAHPWQTLAGIGYKTLPYTDLLGAPVVGDNMYLSMLVETGILGIAALLWLNLTILRTAARAAHARNPEKAFLGAWILCFWSGQIVQMLSADLLTFWRVLPVYFWVLALAVRE